jgi:hypothetical protein
VFLLLRSDAGAVVSRPARADPGAIGVSLEAPVINRTLFRAHYEIEDGSRFQHSSVRVGPNIDEADSGPQVLGLVGVTLAPNAILNWGARAGFAPTCLEGGDGGDGGKDINVQVEAFARYFFPLEPSRFRPFLEGGPFAARTCHGNTYDQGIAKLGGLHLGPAVSITCSMGFRCISRFAGSPAGGATPGFPTGRSELSWTLPICASGCSSA